MTGAIGNVNVRNEIIGVSTTSINIAPARTLENPRKVIYIKNISTAGQKITLRFGAGQAVNNAGIVLDMGEYVADSTDAGRLCWQGEIQAISSAANGTIAIMEW